MAQIEDEDNYPYLTLPQKYRLLIQNTSGQRIIIHNQPVTVPVMEERIIVEANDERPHIERIRDVDHLFSYFDKLRQRIVQRLIEQRDDYLKSVWSPDSELIRDQTCRVKVGQNRCSVQDHIKHGIIVPTNNQFYKCRSCNLLEFLALLPEINIGQIFSPKYGINKNKNFVLVKFGKIIIRIAETNIQQSTIKRLIARNELAVACQPQLPILARSKFYGLDKFTNMILINYYLQWLLARQNMTNIRKLYYAFICGKDGYALMEQGNYSSIKKLTVNYFSQAWSILFQLFSLLHYLKPHNISFQVINDETILVENKHCKYYYDGLEVSGEVTLKLNDLTTAGINIQIEPEHGKKLEQSERLEEAKYRILRLDHRVLFTDEFYQKTEQNVIKIDHEYSLAKVPGEKPPFRVIYKIAPPRKNLFDYGKYINDPDYNIHETNDEEAFLYANRLGLPLYQGSFDAYRIMLLMCNNKSFYSALLENDMLNSIWREFWSVSDYEVINNRIHQTHESGALGKVKYGYSKMLLGLSLRCNIVSDIWRKLKEYARSQHKSTALHKSDTRVVIKSPS